MAARINVLSIVAIVLSVFAVHCSAHAEATKLNCTHIGKLTVCTKN